MFAVVLDPLRLVNVAIMGARGRQTISMCHVLHDSLDMIDWETFRDPEKATEASTCERLISSPATESHRVRDVSLANLEERGLAAADLDVEVIVVQLYPCYSKLDESICANVTMTGRW